MRCSNPPPSLPSSLVASNPRPHGWRPTFSRVVERRHRRQTSRDRCDPQPETTTLRFLYIRDIWRETGDKYVEDASNNFLRGSRLFVWKFEACSLKMYCESWELRWRVIVRRLRGERGNFSHETMKFFYLNLPLRLERLRNSMRQEGLRIYFLLVFLVVAKKILRMSLMYLLIQYFIFNLYLISLLANHPSLQI